ncbi:MAG: DMT family transporter [Pseudomonadota bacterium]|nr:DMT family transporter [Pseudomonadota bacterium]
MQHQLKPLSVAFVAAALGIATYSGMDVAMKGLALQIGAYNAMFWRSLITIVLAGSLYGWRKPAWPLRSVLRLHIWRGFIVSIMAFLFFWGLKYLPVAEAIGLSFIAPLIALYLSAVILHEQISRLSIVASAIGLIGAGVVIGGRLSGDYNFQMGQGILAILCSAVLYAYNLILQRQQALVAAPIEIGFFQNLTVILVFGALAPILAVVPPPAIAPQLFTASILGLFSMLMMSWAYARAPASTLLPVEYTAFAWAALFGWVFFSEAITSTTVLGTAMIVTGCLVAAWQTGDTADAAENPAL